MKNKSVVVFGVSALSSLTWFCLTNDSQWKVKAFTVNKKFLTKSKHEGIPVVPFEDLLNVYPPGTTNILIPLGFTRINGLRMERFQQATELDYGLISYISSRACVWPNQCFGRNCLIYEHAIIQPFSKIGDNVIIRSGANIGHHCVIGNHSFIATEAALGGNITVGERCFIGVGAVIRDGLKIAERSFIGAGAVVISDTEPDGVYVGNPARRIARSALEVTGGQLIAN
jgi:sugar O-acyltransferase (sialic acid O-acetyltransferase NeuD family)